MNGIPEAAARVAKFAGNPHFERSCHGKIPFGSEPEALKHAKLMHKRFKRPFSAYRCQFCGTFHVGSTRSKEAGKRRALKLGEA